jgi:hypothetical protein
LVVSGAGAFQFLIGPGLRIYLVTSGESSMRIAGDEELSKVFGLEHDLLDLSSLQEPGEV